GAAGDTVGGDLLGGEGEHPRPRRRRLLSGQAFGRLTGADERLVRRPPVAGGGMAEGLDAGQPGVGDGWAAAAQRAAGTAGQVEGLDAVAGVRLERREAADLVRGEQRVTRGPGGVDGGSVA